MRNTCLLALIWLSGCWNVPNTVNIRRGRIEFLLDIFARQLRKPGRLDIQPPESVVNSVYVFI